MLQRVLWPAQAHLLCASSCTRLRLHPCQGILLSKLRAQELGKMGFKYQFVTLAGFHAINHGMFELSMGYKKRGMAAYSELQQQEFAAEARGYTATKHQREVRCLSDAAALQQPVGSA